MNKIVAIQADLRQSRKQKRITLLQPDRKYITTENLSVKEMNGSDFHKRRIVLFNDLALITKPHSDSKKKREQLKLISCIDLSEIEEIVKATSGKTKFYESNLNIH